MLFIFFFSCCYFFLKLLFSFLLFFWPCRVTYRILAGFNPRPQRWKHRVLTTSPLGKSLFPSLLKNFYLFLVALGLSFGAQAFSSCSERRLLFIAVCGLLIASAFLVVKHRLQMCGLQ